MICVEHIMEKGLITVAPGDSVGRVAGLMEHYRIGGMPVLDDKQLVGIITSRDVRRSHPNRLVADSMSREVVTVSPHSSLWHAKKLMDDYNIERLVVIKEGQPTGVITMTTLVAELGKHVDALTGLYRAEFIKRKVLDLLQEGKEIAIIFLDLDKFGRIDKEYGHVIGDSILRKTAQLLNSVMEEDIDYLCRYGGDEFAVVTIKSWEEAKELANRMIDALAAEEWPGGIKVTGSVGITGSRVRLGRGSENENKIAVSNLINAASLASTNAKRVGVSLAVAGQENWRSRNMLRINNGGIQII